MANRKDDKLGKLDKLLGLGADSRKPKSLAEHLRQSGQLAPKPVDIEALRAAKPEAPTRPAKLDLVPTEEERLLYTALGDCLVGESGDSVRNFVLMSSVLKGENLTPELESVVESKGDITEEQMAQVGWDSTLQLLGSLSPAVYAIGEVRKELQAETDETRQKELAKKIAQMQFDTIAKPAAQYYFDHKKYPPGSTPESLAELYMKVVDSYELLVTKCFEEGDRSGHRFVEAVRKRVFGEKPADGDLVLETQGIEASLANAMMEVAEQLGWAAAMPMNRVYNQLELGLKNWDMYAGKSSIARRLELGGDYVNAEARRTKAVESFMASFTHLNESLEALKDERAQQIIDSKDIVEGKTSLAPNVLKDAVSAAKSLKGFISAQPIAYANGRLAKTLGEIGAGEERDYSTYMNSRLASVLIDANEIDKDIELFTAKAATFPAGETMDRSSRELHDLCFSFRAITHRFKVLIKQTEMLGVDAAHAAGTPPTEGWLDVPPAENEYFKQPPANISPKLKNFLRQLEQSCKVVHKNLVEKRDMIQAQSEKMDAVFPDKLDIAHDQLIRMQDSLTRITDLMRPRYEQIQATIDKSSAAAIGA